LPISVSELHGLICGYVCAGLDSAGETYLRTLLSSFPKEKSREAMKALFELFTLSQQQMSSGDFAFYMLLPDDEESLPERAKAFSEWCEGFTQGITLSGIRYEDLEDDETKEALHHISEFAQLDYEAMKVSESDEKAFLEVSEYTRMAVIQLHDTLLIVQGNKDKTTH
jgi:uncharacterized protein